MVHGPKKLTAPPSKPNSIEAYPMRLRTVMFVPVTALCTRYFFDAMSSLDDDGDSDGGNELFKALDVEQDDASGSHSTGYIGAELTLESTSGDSDLFALLMC